MTTYNQTQKREARATIRRLAGAMDFAITRHNVELQLELSERILVSSAKLVNALREEVGQDTLTLTKELH